MKANIRAKLDKVYALYNDDAAKKTQESEAALNKLKDLCKKHKVDFEEYMKSKGQSEPAQEEAKETEGPRPTPFVFRSRRNCIINLLREGIWDKAAIAEAVVYMSKGKYANLKQNMKAVSGTIYDLNAHSHTFVKTCETGRLYCTKQ